MSFNHICACRRVYIMMKAGIFERVRRTDRQSRPSCLVSLHQQSGVGARDRQTRRKEGWQAGRQIGKQRDRQERFCGSMCTSLTISIRINDRRKGKDAVKTSSRVILPTSLLLGT